MALYTSMFLDNPALETTAGTLKDIADITMGQSPSGSSYNEDGNGEERIGISSFVDQCISSVNELMSSVGKLISSVFKVKSSVFKVKSSVYKVISSVNETYVISC